MSASERPNGKSHGREQTVKEGKCETAWMERRLERQWKHCTENPGDEIGHRCADQEAG